MRRFLWVWTPQSILKAICFVLGHDWKELGEIELPVQVIKLDGTFVMRACKFPHRFCRFCCWLEIEGFDGQLLKKEEAP